MIIRLVIKKTKIHLWAMKGISCYSVFFIFLWVGHIKPIKKPPITSIFLLFILKMLIGMLQNHVRQQRQAFLSFLFFFLPLSNIFWIHHVQHLNSISGNPCWHHHSIKQRTSSVPVAASILLLLLLALLLLPLLLLAIFVLIVSATITTNNITI
jgi:hypothetical protein